MKILLGGAFDPIHCGHIQLALDISYCYQHPVDLLPLSGTPNYKPQPVASLAQRLAMLQLIKAKYPQQINLDCSETYYNHYSPTIITLKRMRAELNCSDAMFFIIGSDALITLDSWHEWQQLLNLTNFIVVARPGYDLEQMSAELKQVVTPRLTTQLNKHSIAGKIIVYKTRPSSISSTAIRARCKNAEAIDTLVPAEIANYIITHNLYR